MADAIDIVKTSMLADLERLTTYGQNFANATTVGYKRQVPITLAFDQLVNDGTSGLYGASGITASATDFETGAVRNTGRSLDVALEGDGFLVVDTANGERYTRRGDLGIDGQGRLVFNSGDPVAGGAGIRLQNDKVSIAEDGTITAGGQTVGHLETVSFDDPSQLVYEGDGLFSAGTATVAERRDPVRVRQGFLEASNVQPAQDMLGLMETQRHFGLIHNAATAYDQMLDAAINTLSES